MTLINYIILLKFYYKRLLLPHPTVRRYCNYDEITEVDPEYYL